ncbi:MAG: VWA domain-containing protein [Candidatus Acidiferrales bacterium]
MSCRRSIKIIFVIVVSLVGPGAIQSQEPAQKQADTSHPISVDTEMVRIPTIVTNSLGTRISDLTIHDFAILENGRPQQIAFFEHIQTKAVLQQPKQLPENEVSNTYEKTPGRLTIILLDTLNTSFRDQERARRSIRKFLADSIVSTEPVALMTLSSAGITVVHDFTMEPGALAEALKSVPGRRSISEVAQPVPVEPLKSISRMGSMNNGVDYTGLEPLQTRQSVFVAAGRMRTMETQANINGLYGALAVEVTLASLREIGEAFAGIPGRKSLIWATGGVAFPADDKHVVNTWMGSLSTMYEDTWLALNRADIAMYPLDVEGLVNPSYVSPAFGRRFYGTPSLKTSVYDMEEFARMTGGRMCYVKTEIDGCFRQAAADSSDYYLLGFYPQPGPKKSGWQKLTIRVERSNTKVQARTRYFVGETRDPNSGRKEDLQLGLISPLDYTDFPLTVRWTGNTEISGKKLVGFQFLLAQGAATVDESDGNHLSMDFAAMAVSAKGKIAGEFSKQMEGKLGPAPAKAIKSGNAFFPGEMELAAGDYMVRFVVRDNLSGRMGSISTSLKIP